MIVSLIFLATLVPLAGVFRVSPGRLGPVNRIARLFSRKDDATADKSPPAK